MTLNKRFVKHKKPKGCRPCSSKEIIDAGDAEILEVEAFPCTCKEELEDREAEFIVNNFDDCVNKIIPGALRRAGSLQAYMKVYNRTPEYRAQCRAYTQSAKGKAKRKAYAQTPEAKAKRKQRMQKPEAKAKNLAYQQTPEAKAYRREKIPCKVCGAIVSRQGISRHQKSQTCQKHLKTELDKVMEDIISSIENC